MRILYLSADPGVPVLGHKGASIHLRELANALHECGATVAIASPRLSDEGGRLGGEARLAWIPPVLPKQLTEASVGRAMTEQTDAVVAVAQEVRADVVYERFSLFSVAGARAALRLGVPHLLEVNAPLREEAARFRTLPHPEAAANAEQEVFMGSATIFSVSEPLAEWVRSRCEARVEVMPNGVDPARFPPPARRRDDRFVVGFAGSLKPWHGIDVMLDACRIAMTEHPTLHLEIVGGGPMSVAIHRADLPAGRLVMHGLVDHTEAIRLMSNWHVGLAPYHDQPRFYFSPLKVLEYMAAAVCPVASDLGQIRDLLGDGERGVLVRAGDAMALAQTLAGLVANPAAAESMAAAAREHVLRSHTWQANARRVIDLAEALLARRAA